MAWTRMSDTGKRGGGKGPRKAEPAREQILTGIRRYLMRRGQSADRPGTLRAWLANRKPNPTPAAARGSQPDLIQRFLAKAEAVNVVTRRLPAWNVLAQAVQADLAAEIRLSRIAVANDPRLEGFQGWEGLTIHRLDPELDEVAALTVADWGIAETGTLAFTSAVGRRLLLNAIPRLHFVALSATDIVGGMEDCLARCRAQGEGVMPRGLMLVTGPSRTGDIEQTLQLGAHGPVKLFVYVIDARSQ